MHLIKDDGGFEADKIIEDVQWNARNLCLALQRMDAALERLKALPDLKKPEEKGLTPKPS